MRRLPFSLLLAACGAAPSPEPATAPAAPPSCASVSPMSERAAQAVQERAIACAAQTLRSGMTIRGSVEGRVHTAPAGELVTNLDIHPLERADAYAQCLAEPGLAVDPCTEHRIQLAFESELDLPAQARSGVVLEPGQVPRLIEGEGTGTNAVVVRAQDGLDDTAVRRALTIAFHRAAERCFLQAAEAALEEGTPFDQDIPAVLGARWSSARVRTWIVSAPSDAFADCIRAQSGGTITENIGTEGSAELELPLRRYLHPDVLASLRDR